MISVEVLLRQMAWANQEIYKEVGKLDSKVLNYYVFDPEWTVKNIICLLYTSPSPRDGLLSRMPSSA